MDPADRDALLAQARALHRAGRPAEAATRYRELLRLRPEDPQALTLLGVLALEKDEAKAAIELLGRSLAVAPDQPMAHLAGALARPLWVLLSFMPHYS